MTFKLVQKTMPNHHKNEDKNNIEKERFPPSLPNQRAGQEVYPNIKGGTSWHQFGDSCLLGTYFCRCQCSHRFVLTFGRPVDL